MALPSLVAPSARRAGTVISLKVCQIPAPLASTLLQALTNAKAAPQALCASRTAQSSSVRRVKNALAVAAHPNLFLVRQESAALTVQQSNHARPDTTPYKGNPSAFSVPEGTPAPTQITSPLSAPMATMPTRWG